MGLRTTFALLLVSFGLWGCNRSDSGSMASTQPTAPSPVSEVRLGYFPNLTHAQAVLGVDSGEFASAVAPAKFSGQPFNAGPLLIEALFNHVIDVGYVGPGPAVNAFAKSHGEDVRVISGAAANGVIIVARKDSGIQTLADLAGKKIATPQAGNTQDIAAKHYLTTVLKQSDTKNVLAIANTDQVGMMSRGDIDASWAPEPWGSLLINQTGAKLVAEEKDLWPGKEFSLTVIVTTPDFLAAHPDVIEKLLTVNRSWTARLNAEPAKYVPQLEQALFKLTNKKFPSGVVADALGRVKFTDEALPSTFEANAQWAVEVGAAKQTPDLATLTDFAILRKLQKQ